MRVRGVLALLAGVLFAPPALAGQAADDEQPSAATRASPTAADPVPAGPVEAWSPPKLRYTAIYWIGGLGTPVGIGGFEAVHHFGSTPFELAVGVGSGLSAAASQKNASLAHVLQWSAMPRVRVGDEANALPLGIGVSGGNFGEVPLFDDGSPNTYPTKYTLWANFELGGEHWSRHGFALRYFVGFAKGCAVSGCVKANSGPLPYLGLGLGYAW